jgi:hypothetical protein
MKDLLKFLPQFLEMMPGIVKYLKYIPILMVLAGIGYGIFYVSQNYRDPFKCVDNQIYEQVRVDSNVYEFKGGYCVEGTDERK